MAKTIMKVSAERKTTHILKRMKKQGYTLISKKKDKYGDQTFHFEKTQD